MKRNFLIGLAAVLLLGLAGCQNATSNSPDPIVGSWTNNTTTITFTDTKTWSLVNSARPPGSSGTWSKAGIVYTLTQTSPATTSPAATATVSGTALTLTTGSGVTTVYTKN